jgi:lysophospholipase L1-like esterase
VIAPARFAIVIAALALALIGVAVPTAAPAKEGIRSYVALGDSFTAGPLIANQLDDPVGCFRSDHNYPHLVAASLRIAESLDASCSGASTEDMTAPQEVDPGPDNPPQLDRLDDRTQVVTVSIGGNDIGYADIIRTCATADRTGTPCQDEYVDGGNDEISDRIADTAPKVDDVLEGIRSRAPDARVFVVNYLSLLPETGSGCWPQMPFADADVPYLRGKQHELNAVLRKQAAANDATLVDVFAASIGHDACQTPGVRWAEPIVGASSAPPGHPNQLGMECTAVVAAAAIAPAAPAAPDLCAPKAVVAVPNFTG